jgi:hypothetical protein
LEERVVPAGTVMDLSDASAVSLRNCCVGGGLVNFAPGLSGVIHLTTGEIKLLVNTTIVGDDPAGNPVNVTIDGLGRDRIFDVFPGVSVSITGDPNGSLTLTNGYARLPRGTGPGMGGAILNQGDLTLRTVTLSYNRAQLNGGAIDNFPFLAGTAAPPSVSLQVYNSAFLGNEAKTGLGGAISTDGGQRQVSNTTSVLVDGSFFYANRAAKGGGGIDFEVSPFAVGPAASGISRLTVQNYSFFQGNEAANGGAIFCGTEYGASTPITAGDWRMNVVNSIFDSNAATGPLTPTPSSGFGGAIHIAMNLTGSPAGGGASKGSVAVCGCVLTGNEANWGGGISVVLQTSGLGTGTVVLDQDTLGEPAAGWSGYIQYWPALATSWPASVGSNFATWGGGAYLDVTGGSLVTATRWSTSVTLTNSTVDDNVATSADVSGPVPVVNAQGGGICSFTRGNTSTLVDFVNDTVAYNSAVTSTSAASQGLGGGIYLNGSNPNRTATISMNSITVAYNYADTAGGGLWTPADPPLYPLLRNSLFDLNDSAVWKDIFGLAVSTGYNWTSTAVLFPPVIGDNFGAGDLLLDTQLALNGNGSASMTLTLTPLASSPVIMKGFPGQSQFDDSYYDQRGYVRFLPTTPGALDPLASFAAWPVCTPMF